MFGRFTRAAAALVVTTGALPLAAQSVDPQCSAQVTQLQDACQKAVDLFQFVAPSLGGVITGGNATLGQVGTNGKLGHFSLGLRVVGMETDLPQVNQVTMSTSGAQQSTYPTKPQWIGFPTADLTVGGFSGYSLGFIQLPSVDLLANFAYLPEVSVGDYDLKAPNGSFKVGYGARLGLIKGDGLLPAVAATFLRRDLPTIALLGAGLTTSDNDSISLSRLDVKTSSWRVTVGKKTHFISAVVGAGKDRYNSGATIRAVVAPRTVPTYAGGTSTVDIGQKIDRTNIFADVNLLFLHFEGGRVSGGKAGTYNGFADGKKPTDTRTYFATGFRFGF